MVDDWDQTPSVDGGYQIGISGDGNIIGVNKGNEGLFIKNILTGEHKRINENKLGEVVMIQEILEQVFCVK